MDRDAGLLLHCSGRISSCCMVLMSYAGGEDPMRVVHRVCCNSSGQYHHRQRAIHYSSMLLLLGRAIKHNILLCAAISNGTSNRFLIKPANESCSSSCEWCSNWWSYLGWLNSSFPWDSCRYHFVLNHSENCLFAHNNGTLLLPMDANDLLKQGFLMLASRPPETEYSLRCTQNPPSLYSFYKSMPKTTPWKQIMAFCLAKWRGQRDHNVETVV